MQRTQGKPWAKAAAELLNEEVPEPSSGSESQPSSHEPTGTVCHRSEREEEGLKKKKSKLLYEGTEILKFFLQ